MRVRLRAALGLPAPRNRVVLTRTQAWSRGAWSGGGAQGPGIAGPWHRRGTGRRALRCASLREHARLHITRPVDAPSPTSPRTNATSLVSNGKAGAAPCAPQRPRLLGNPRSCTVAATSKRRTSTSTARTTDNAQARRYWYSEYEILDAAGGRGTTAPPPRDPGGVRLLRRIARGGTVRLESRSRMSSSMSARRTHRPRTGRSRCSGASSPERPTPPPRARGETACAAPCGGAAERHPPRGTG